MELAPIILFAYNRPLHTTQTLEALSKNKGINECILYVYADGPKESTSNDQIDNILKVRKLLQEVTWTKELHIIERDKNYGLAENIIDGVTTVINKHGSAIILEDDIVTSPGFVQYMNQALSMYQDESEVMHISGYMFPIITDDINSTTFFYNTTSCWGWATWADRWSKLITDSQIIWNKIEEREDFKNFNIGGWANFSKQLRDNIKGYKKTWAIKWYGTLFLANGYSLHPRYSLVQNIGNDDSGENSSKTKYYNNHIVETLNVSKLDIRENEIIRNRMRKYYYNQKKVKHVILKYFGFLMPRNFINTPFIN